MAIAKAAIKRDKVAMNTCIVIPARMASTRLPGKPLADIAGVPMVLRVAMAARKAGFAEPLIAAADKEIFDCAQAAGFSAVITPPELPSGTDRVQAAINSSPLTKEADFIVNLQGDLPAIAPELIQKVVRVLERADFAQIATLIAKVTSESEKSDPDVVKAIVTALGPDGNPLQDDILRALYFTRAAAPFGDGPMYQHIGIYAYRRDALARFTSLSPSELERVEKLEQLRALENGMQIAAAVVDEVPIGVDNPEDLEQVRVGFKGDE